MIATQTMVGSSNGVGLWVAPVGTAAPTSISTAFADPWLSLGYVSDDGVTLAGDTTTESFTPWQSTVPIRTVVTERTRTVAFTMWQLNQTTLGVYFDKTITGTGDTFNFDVLSNQSQLYHAVAVDALDGERHLRIIYPRANLESTGDMALTRGAMVPLEVTLSALDYNGVLATVYVAQIAAPPSGDTVSAETAGGSSGRRSSRADVNA
jgi:hypothetical protein